MFWGRFLFSQCKPIINLFYIQRRKLGNLNFITSLPLNFNTNFEDSAFYQNARVDMGTGGNSIPTCRF